MFLRKPIFQKNIVSIILFFTMSALWGDLIEIGGGTGCLPLTDEEQFLIEAEIAKVVEIHPNALGMERIENYLINQNLSPEIFKSSTPKLEHSVVQGSIMQALNMMPSAVGLPRSIDNSSLPAFPPIGNQGHLNACVPFATTYYQASHEIALTNGINNKASLNGVLSPKWTYNLINDGVDGGSSFKEALNLLASSGAPSIVSFPYDTNYTQWATDPNQWIDALSNRMAKWTFIPGLGGSESQNLTAIKQALVNGHVLVFGTYIYSWRTTQIQPDPSFPNSPYVGQLAAYYVQGRLGTHAMTIVGYDDDLWIDVNQNGIVDEGERGAFLVANSWGTNWGNKGFIWVSYDAFLATSAVAGGPVTDREPLASVSMNGTYFATSKAPFYTPVLVAQFSLSQTRRDQFNISVGSAPLGSSFPTVSTPLPAFAYQGGPREFDGTLPTSTSQTVVFAADLSDFLTAGLQTPIQNYYLSVSDNALDNPTTLNNFSLIDRINQKTVSWNQSPVSIDSSRQFFGLSYGFMQDVLPPTISFITPVASNVLKGSIPIAVSAVDNIGIASVEFDIDSSFYTVLTSRPYTVSLDTTKMANGNHTIQAIATDLTGNKSTATMIVQVQNDLSPPLVSITSPINGATIKGVVSLAATATDNVSLAQVVFYADAVQIAADTTAPYTALLDTRSLSNGTHQIRAVAIDTSNNQTTATITVQVQNDFSPPIVSITSPVNGATIKGVIPVTATATDNVALAQVVFYADAVQIAADTMAPYTAVFDTRSLSNGTHQIRAVAIDTSNNQTTTTITVQVQNDLSPPVISITSPANGATIKGIVSLTAAATDNVALSQVVFYMDAVQIATDTATPYTATLDTQYFSNGTHQIRAVAIDTSNNQTTATIQIQVQNPVLPAGIYVNAGGPVVGFGGVSWISDNSYQTGGVGVYTQNLPTANPVYDTGRYGNMLYTFPVTNGTHQVTLKFAELVYTRSKKRVFNVSINGKKVISNLDIFAKVGFGIPYDLTFPVTVTNQKITIQFSAATDFATVNAIQITPP